MVLCTHSSRQTAGGKLSTVPQVKMPTTIAITDLIVENSFNLQPACWCQEICRQALIRCQT